MITVSCTVMNAPFDRKRRYSVSALISSLGEEEIRKNWVDFEVMGDFYSRGCWWNAKRCWTHALTMDSTHHLLLQDDVVVCDDFVKGLPSVIAAYPDDVISLFAMPRKGFSAMNRRWGECEGTWGCGIVMPKELIRDFLEWEEANVRPEFKHDDSRISLWCVKTKRTVKVPFPNLVDHLTMKSTLGNSWSKPRVSENFLTSPISAIDWLDNKITMKSINSYTQYNKYLINK